MRIKKCEGTEVKEEQSRAIRTVETSKPNAKDIEDTSPRRRFFDHWMDVTLEAIDVLVEICDRLIPELIHDPEVNYGIKIIRRIADDIGQTMRPFAPVKHEMVQISTKGTSRTLCETLFPKRRRGWNPSYESLVALQGLLMYFGHLQGLLLALAPTSQAMWNGAFIEAVNVSLSQVDRQLKWVTQQIGVRSPQTLLVPSTYKDDGNPDSPVIC